MIIHVVAFQWKPHATEADKQRALEVLRTLQDRIPQVLESHTGFNFSPRSQGYSLALVMKFADRAQLEAYGSQPVHQQLLGWLMPLVDLIELDFQA